MKRYNLILISVLLLFSWRCEYLDYDEYSSYKKEDVFTTFSRTKSFLTNIYGKLPSDFGSIDGAVRGAACDEAEHVWTTSNVQRFNDGTWRPFFAIDSKWATSYSGIRAVNTFLKEIEGQIFEEEQWNLDYEDMMQQFDNYPHEARFLRAFFYFDLIKRYGDVPLFTTPLTEEEANTLTRTPFAEVVSFIVDECDAIITELPTTYAEFSEAQETGRATKGAAMALKARTLLYAASPLHNTANDAGKWEKAAQAANALIEANLYILETDYSAVVNKLTSTELIFEKRQGTSNSFEKANFPIGYVGGNTGTCPTQNLVDAYEMRTTGLPIDNPESGYSEGNPYIGRDRRLSATVLHNQSLWKNAAIETWYGGANAAPKENATKTGYYLKKYVDESISIDPVNATKKVHTWVLFRFGEVLLNYAEAMNEAYGPEDAHGFAITALQAVNEIRLRAGMPDFPAGMSKDDFRTKLRNERRVELAFEDHRFWDIRRWKIGSETTEIYGMKITKSPYGVLEYEKVLVENRVYDDKMNLFPIPQSEIYINSRLVQNTGWLQ